MTTRDELKARIAELRQQAKEAAAPFRAEAEYWAKVLAGPGVTPVVHYMRYHSECEDEHWEDDLVSAFRRCDNMIDEGHAAPIGVSVGGAMTTVEDWKNDPRRPSGEDWFCI